MASDSNIRRMIPPIGWIVAVALSAGVSGWCFANNYTTWSAVLLVATLVFGFVLVNVVLNFGKRVRYIMNATLNGDFSYKFPTAGVNKYERESNTTLNRIVEHFENLSMEIMQKETFLAQVINMTDIGMVVADDKGYVRIHNEATLRLLQRSTLTHICQIDPQTYPGLAISRQESILNGDDIFIYTINDLRHPIQNVEVESWEKLTRVLTHEIMNSLTPICSIAATMTEKETSAEAKDAFDAISSSSRSLIEFVKNFRKFSVLPEVKMRAVSLKPLLENCKVMAEKFDASGNVCINIRCFPPDVMSYTDDVLLSRVIINILKNAIEASSKKVAIETNILPDESVEIRISNDGELIPEEMARQIFTPFFTTRQSGNGIGLSLSRRIITHLGGTLTLQRLPLTTFIIRL